ncbi:MAG: Ca2+/H+ antiporter, family [Acidimicrobiaceae bacterium]|jgi:putative Ca2+/H+ antiporter (TMEM165/GDT1 family)|nr:Ca2+/H+ antiporter, family [Acidimicrobiaceae bacterium]
MNLGIAATVFALIFVAELPDKTMIATLIMGSRYRPVLVWLGATMAFLLHAALAVGVGRLLALLPHRWVEGVTAALFAGGAVYLLFVPEKAEEDKGEDEVAEAPRGFRVVGTAFLVILVGEFGDLTQILTANLAAKYQSPVSVFVGAALGLTSVAAIGAFGGRALTKVLPLAVIRKVGGVLLAGFAVYTLVTLVRG